MKGRVMEKIKSSGNFAVINCFDPALPRSRSLELLTLAEASFAPFLALYYSSLFWLNTVIKGLWKGKETFICWIPNNYQDLQTSDK